MPNVYYGQIINLHPTRCGMPTNILLPESYRITVNFKNNSKSMSK